MGLEVPELDDQRYEALRKAALQRLPTHTADWTDHNAHDPGITILELLAWLIESHSYQIDQVTEEHRRAYLRLLGTKPRRPTPATVQLAIDPPSDAHPMIPAGTPIVVEPPDRDIRIFETDREVALTHAPIAAIVTEDAEGRTDRSQANDQPNRTFTPFGEDATVGNALYLGFAGDPFGPHTQLDLIIDHASPMGRGADTTVFDPSIDVQWQYLTNPNTWFDTDGWTDLATISDETNAWYRGGRVSLPQPPFWEGADEEAAILGRDDPLVWLRAVTRPSIPDEEDLLRYERPPELRAIRTNVVTASHRSHVEQVSLERIDRAGSERPPQPPMRTTGGANQEFAFPQSPVLEAHLTVGEQPWDEVDTFASSGANDRHYRLDHDTGRITFGDGRRGAIPPADAPVTASDVVYGGGPLGNVPRESRWTLRSGASPLNARPLSTPRGGHSSEPIHHAFDRVRGELETPHRAVTAGDYAALAQETPGVAVARASVVDTPGQYETTVVVIPDGPMEQRPIPTPGMRRAVERYLQERALLTDRVAVVAPTYVPVRVNTIVQIVGGVKEASATEAVIDGVGEFLDPLSGYHGDGWPFDRPLYRSDLFEVIDAVSDVADVIDVALERGAVSRLRDDPTSVPFLTNVSVTIDPDAEPCWRDES